MKSKWLKILIPALVIILGIRIALPFYIENFLNNKLKDMNGYRGTIKDINLHLYRGAYVIDSLDFVKTTDSIPVPFISIKKIDLSLQWNALFKGEIVSELKFTNPEINFAKAKSKTKSTKSSKQNGKGVNWAEKFAGFVPVQINRVEIVNGKVAYKDFTTQPEIDIKIDNLHVIAENLSNVQDSSERGLPSKIDATGNAFGEGNFLVDARINILKEVPDLDLNFKIEQVALTKFNEFFKVYTNSDVQKGDFNLYSEIIIKDKDIKGYVKPIIENMEVLDWQDESGDFLHKIWEAIVGGITEVLENQKTERFATNAPIEGSLEGVDTELWPTIWNIFENAFIEAFRKEFEGTVKYKPTSKQDK